MRTAIVAIVLCLSSVAIAQPASQPAADDELMSPAETDAPVEPAARVATPDPERDPGAFVSAISDAVKGGRWLTVVSLAIILVVFLLRRFGARYVKWFATDRGGVVLALACGALASIAGSLVVGWSWGAVLTALEAGVLAAGGWSAAKKLIGA